MGLAQWHILQSSSRDIVSSANVGSLVLDRQPRVRELGRHGRLGCTAIINNQAATSLGTLHEPKVCHPNGPLGAAKRLFTKLVVARVSIVAHTNKRLHPGLNFEQGLHLVRRRQFFILHDVGACLLGDSIDARLPLEVVEAVLFQLQVASLQ